MNDGRLPFSNKNNLLTIFYGFCNAICYITLNDVSQSFFNIFRKYIIKFGIKVSKSSYLKQILIGLRIIYVLTH